MIAANHEGQREGGGFTSVFGVLFLAILTALFFATPDGSNPAIIIACLAIFYFYFSRSILNPISIIPGIPTHAKIETLFLAFYFILFYLPYQLSLFGMADLYRNKFLYVTYVEETNRALVAATVGLVGFCTGMSLIARHGRSNSLARAVLKPLPPEAYRGFGVVTLILLAGLIALYQLAGWYSADEGRYTGITSGGALANGVYTLILMFCVITLARTVALLAERRPLGLVLWLSLTLTALWTGRILLNGDRNSFFVIAIALGGGLMTYCFRARWYVLVACGLASLTLYNVVETFRTLPDRSVGALMQELFTDRQADSFANSSFSITTTTLKASLAIVPEVQDFGFGVYKFIGFAGIIPFIRGALLPDELAFTSTADLISYYMLGSHSVWNTGSNIISDIYIDFGILGVATLMLMLGVTAGYIQKEAARNPTSASHIIVYLMALGLYAELPRYSLDFPVRMIVWTIFLLGIHRFLLRGRFGFQ